MIDEVKLSRQIVPIYEAIDSRNYKLAIKLCCNKKNSHFPLVKILKAHSLERTGHVDEALEICRKVQAEHCPTDEVTLNTMQLVFKLTGNSSEITKSYEYAITKDPNNENLLISLFFCYAREYDFLKQQQIAMRLYKIFHFPFYIYWAGVSVFLQVNCGSSDGNKLLLIAENIVKKVLQMDENKSSEAIQLYLQLLLAQKKYKETLIAFDEFLGCTNTTKDNKVDTPPKLNEEEEEGNELATKMQEVDCLLLEGRLCGSVEEWERCSTAYQKLIENFNSDDWSYWNGFLLSKLALNMDKDISLMIKKMQELGKKKTKCPRSPFLIELEYICLSTKNEIELTEKILLYAERFACNTCAFTDLKRYLTLYLPEIPLKSEIAISNSIQERAKKAFEKQDEVMFTLETNLVISSQSRENLITGLEKIFVDNKLNSQQLNESSELSFNRECMKRHLFALKALRYIGYQEQFTIKEMISLVNELVLEYQLSLSLNVTYKGGQREIQPGDDLLLISCHILIDLSNGHHSSLNDHKEEDINRQYLIEAAILLEWGLKNSLYNFQMKLLLIRIYILLSSLEPALKRYNELEIKQIQLDSLSYLILDDCLRLGYFTEANRICRDVNLLHEMNLRDSPDYIIRAYRSGTFSKAIEVTEFNLKSMKNSHQLAICKGEEKALKILEKSQSLNELHEYLLIAIKKANKKDEDLKDVFSCNQHRSVAVDWNYPLKKPYPVIYCSSYENSTLVQTDRSIEMNSSLYWLKLRSLLINLLFSCAEENQTLLESSRKEYKDLLNCLNLLKGNSLFTKCWKLSILACDICFDVLLSINGSQEHFINAENSIILLNENLNIFFQGIISSCKDIHYGWKESKRITFLIELLSVFVYQSGNWMLIILAFTMKSLRKIKKVQMNISLDELQKLQKSIKECLNLLSKSFTTVESELYQLLKVKVISSLELSKPFISLIATETLKSYMEITFNNEISGQRTSLERLYNLIKERKQFILSIKL